MKQSRRLTCEHLEPRLVLDSTVVFNELMYHPADDEARLEWLELYNQMAVDMDLSGWSLDGGIQFEFSEGTRIGGGEYLVVAVSPEDLEAVTGYGDALGPFTGRLANSEDTIELRNNSGRLMDSIHYQDDGDWPVGADGSGASLVKIGLTTASEPAENWTSSPRINGSPGEVNFPTGAPDVSQSTLVAIDATWRFDQSGSDLGTAWRETGFDDSGWAAGPALLFHESASLPAAKNTPLDLGQVTYYFRTDFQFDGDLDAVTLKLRHIIDDGAVFYLNGQEVYRYNMTDGAISAATTARTGIGNAGFQGPLVIPSGDLVVGNNVLAVELHQFTAGSNDLVFGAEVVAEAAVVPEDNALPSLAINEIAASLDAPFWLELVNYGDSTLSLADYVLAVAGSAAGEIVLPPHALAPGEFITLDQTQLGMDPNSGDKVFLYTPGKTGLVDAAVVDGRLRGRFPQATGPWLYPAVATPATENQFEFQDEIVINEIFYHARPVQAVPAVEDNVLLFGVESEWTYDDAGIDRGTAWREFGFDDGSWAAGAALFSNDGSAAGVNTMLTAGRNTYYFRQPFDFTGDPSAVALNIDTKVDDGAVFYLNGEEVLRWNMPAGDVSYGTFAAEVVGAADFSGRITIPSDGLVVGENLLAVEVHQAAPGGPSSGVTLSGGGLALTEEGPLGAPVPMNLARQPGASVFAIDSLAGFPIHDVSGLNDGVYGNSNSWIGNSGNPAYAGVILGGVHFIDSIAFGRDNLGSFTDRTLGLYTLQYTQVAEPGTRTGSTGDPATGWATIGTINYRGAGSGNFANPSRRHRFAFDPVTATGIRLMVPAAGISGGTAIDEIEVNPPGGGDADVVFGGALFATQTLEAAVPFHESPEAWIELFNRGPAAVDLTGWRFSDGVNFAFAPGTVIGPGEYLVVANDADALLAKFPGIDVAGSFAGRLSHKGERIELRDADNNPADVVHYFDGGRWDSYADGGGSSLELRDPLADNNTAESWAASDETQQSQWQSFSYRGVAQAEAPTARWNEFVVGLFGEGEVLLDDIRVVEFPDGAATHKLQNGDFENDAVGAAADKWRVVGNHGRSRVVVDPQDSSNHVLHLISTGQTSDRSNHAETTFIANRPAVNGREYEISFRAQWLAGSNFLNTRLYFNRLARRTQLPVPDLAGTPGSLNSRTVSNLGPTYQNLRHSPVVPAAGEPVTVSIEAIDPDVVDSLLLHYSVNGRGSNTVAFAPQGDGVFTAVIPGQLATATLQFYVQGRDGRGATSMYPAAGVDSRALIQVEDGQAATGRLHNLRIIMTAGDTAQMHNVANVMSNGLTRATVVYNETEVFYDVGVRLKGSMASRPNSAFVGFALQFDPDRLFRGVHEEIAVDRSGRGALVGNGQDEILVKQLMNHAGGIASMVDDLIHIIAPRSSETGSALLLLAEHGDVFLDSQFDGGSDGTLFNYDLIYHQNNTTNGSPEGLKTPVGYGHPSYNVDIEDLGDDQERYRWHFRIKNNRDRDDYSRLIEFAQAMSLTGAALDAATRELMDVDQWMRVFALQSLAGVGPDIYTRGLNHNLRLYVRPSDQKVLAFPWDMDLSVFGLSTSAPLWGGSNLRKVIEIPSNTRLFHGHLLDLMNTTVNRQYMTYWVDHFSSLLPGQNFASALNYVDARNTFVTGQLPAEIPFNITTNAGQPFEIDDVAATIEGDGWINVREIRLAGDDQPLSVVWTDQDSWQVTVPLNFGPNDLVFEAYDFQGSLIATDTITVTSTLQERPLVDHLRVTELMFHPAEPSAEEISAGFTDDGDFEYLELTNIGAESLDLSAARFTDGIAFDFAGAGVTALAPGGHVLVVRNTAAFQFRYGAGLPVAGQYSGRLNNAGEDVRLEDTAGAVILNFHYDDVWYPTTDGNGHSLVIIDATADPASWSDAASWRPSASLGGSPGQSDAEPLPGDTNGDGRVDIDDLNAVRNNFGATGAAGDANGDGQVDIDDLNAVRNNFGASIPTAPRAARASIESAVTGLPVDVFTLDARAARPQASTPRRGGASRDGDRPEFRVDAAIEQLAEQSLPQRRARSLLQVFRGHETDLHMHAAWDEALLSLVGHVGNNL